MGWGGPWEEGTEGISGNVNFLSSALGWFQCCLGHFSLCSFFPLSAVPCRRPGGGRDGSVVAGSARVADACPPSCGQDHSSVNEVGSAHADVYKILTRKLLVHESSVSLLVQPHSLIL